jgi:DNA repair exonuclease SbcCD ATPase subunit
MITRIECATCSGVVEVTSSSVTLPFYCTACKSETGDYEAEQFYEDMAPAKGGDGAVATNALLEDFERQVNNLEHEITRLENQHQYDLKALEEAKAHEAVWTYMRKLFALETEMDGLSDRNSALIENTNYCKSRLEEYRNLISEIEMHPWRNLWAYLWE